MFGHLHLQHARPVFRSAHAAIRGSAAGLSAVLAVVLTVVLTLVAHGPAKAQADTLGPQLATPLRAVQALLAAGKAQDAMATIRDIERKVPDRSLYETYLLERLKAAAAVALSDDASAVAALEASLKTGKASVEERRTVLAQLAGLGLKTKDLEAAGRWARAHLEAGGQEDSARATIVRAALAKGDCQSVVEQLSVLVPAAEQRGERPPEAQLRASAACHAKLGQDLGYFRDLQRLVKYYPGKAYWADLIARLQRLPDFADRLLLDSFRLMLHVGAMEDADDFTGAAQLAMRAGLPAHALRFLKAGFEAGVLGKEGTGGASQRQLLARVQAEADADAAQVLPLSRQAEGARDARQKLVAGRAAWSHGRHDLAIALIEQAMALGLNREADEAGLHLALAMAASGRREDARKVLAGLPERDGLADLARLWMIALR